MRTNIFSTISITALAAFAIGFTGTAQAATITEFNHGQAPFTAATAGDTTSEITFSGAGAVLTNTPTTQSNTVTNPITHRSSTSYTTTVDGTFSQDGVTFTSSVQGTGRTANSSNPGNALEVNNLQGFLSPYSATTLQSFSGDVVIDLPANVIGVGADFGDNQFIGSDSLAVTLVDGTTYSYTADSPSTVGGATYFLGFLANTGDISSIEFNQGGGTFDMNDLYFVTADPVVTSTPEPSQTAAFGIGAFGLLALGYRARRRSTNAI